MEIQQKEKESLAAYIHCFKREARRCKFDNDAATITIFIKGLKNVHTLATRVYEKGPQSLADAIKEVEKLQAAQQLTATLLPSSSVNVMSSDDDKCFQCQELGHMACHCPCIKCLIMMNMAMLQQIAQTKSCHQVHLQDKEIPVLTQDAMIDLPLTMTIKAGTVAVTIKIDMDLTG